MKDIRLGFTGTQYGGMTEDQFMRVAALVTKLKGRIEFATHGDCINADEEFHGICFDRKVNVIVRPGDNPLKRAYCSVGVKNKFVIFTDEPQPMMDRNQVIVDTSNLLIATPKGFVEEQRSGTWATIRRARKAGIALIIIYPDGRWEKFGPVEEGGVLPKAALDALADIKQAVPVKQERVASAQTMGMERTDVTDYTIKDPNEEASGKQLYVMNKHGMLSINAKKGKTITKGEASPVISKMFEKSA